jgi:ribonuclease E
MEEIRVAVIDGEKLDKFDFETPSKAQIKGNVYLAIVVRVEPSLQAAFVDYGGERHGFLSFSEIHHDYFQIPVGDREELEERIQNAMAARADDSTDGEDEIDPREISRLRYQFYRRYKIQEVIKKRQIMLVQVTKEERGNKGAALTTYISLAGRYCVLMPNMSKGSGVSRKVANPDDREKLKAIVEELPVENGSTVIRTAGIGRSKLEIKKDFDYLKKLWDEIRNITLKSTAPCLIYEEANIIKRAIRDLYSRDVESIIVEGEEGYKIAKNYVKKLMPSHSKKIIQYSDAKVPLFSKYKINEQVNQIYSTRVDLPSGGYLVINTTEALISIDVNSGRSTRERNIAGTALKTNLEAAVEVARQCRLRDLAGLIVVDFIDMGEKRNNAQVERTLRDALREDKAKIQVGSISHFGLLEFSRQRMRSSIADANMITCPHCNGSGTIWSNESIALQILRKIEEACFVMDLCEVTVTLSMDVALYLLNNKRAFIASIEKRGLKINFIVDSSIAATDFKITQVVKSVRADSEEDSEVAAAVIKKRSYHGKDSVSNKRYTGGTVYVPINPVPEAKTEKQILERSDEARTIFDSEEFSTSDQISAEIETAANTIETIGTVEIIEPNESAGPSELTGSYESTQSTKSQASDGNDARRSSKNRRRRGGRGVKNIHSIDAPLPNADAESAALSSQEDIQIANDTDIKSKKVFTLNLKKKGAESSGTAAHVADHTVFNIATNAETDAVTDAVASTAANVSKQQFEKKKGRGNRSKSKRRTSVNAAPDVAVAAAPDTAIQTINAVSDVVAATDTTTKTINATPDTAVDITPDLAIPNVVADVTPNVVVSTSEQQSEKKKGRGNRSKSRRRAASLAAKSESIPEKIDIATAAAIAAAAAQNSLRNIAIASDASSDYQKEGIAGDGLMVSEKHKVLTQFVESYFNYERNFERQIVPEDIAKSPQKKSRTGWWKKLIKKPE